MLGLVVRPPGQRREGREASLFSALQEALECPVCRDGLRAARVTSSVGPAGPDCGLEERNIVMTIEY